MLLRTLGLALSLAALSAGALSASAEADAGGRRSEPPALLRLTPTPELRHRQRVDQAERRLEALLRALPGVIAAHVHVELPDGSAAALDRPLPDARATILLTARARPDLEREVRALCTSAVRGLSAGHVGLVVRPPPHAEASLTRVGPFRLAPESASHFRAILGLSLAANVLMALLVLARLRSRSTTARGRRA